MFLQHGYTKNRDVAGDIEAQELEEDMKTAAHTLTFFGTCIALASDSMF